MLRNCESLDEFLPESQPLLVLASSELVGAACCRGCRFEATPTVTQMLDFQSRLPRLLNMASALMKLMPLISGGYTPAYVLSP